MRLMIDQKQLKRFRKHLRRAGIREIGGMLFGEHLGDENFRLLDFSVQHTGGSVSHFVRDDTSHDLELQGFYDKHGRDYLRFNYLGDWHSHPSFSVQPSALDIKTVQDAVSNSETRVNFLILLIVKLEQSTIAASATLFVDGKYPKPVALELWQNNQSIHGHLRKIWYKALSYFNS